MAGKGDRNRISDRTSYSNGWDLIFGTKKRNKATLSLDTNVSELVVDLFQGDDQIMTRTYTALSLIDHPWGVKDMSTFAQKYSEKLEEECYDVCFITKM